MHFFYRYFLSGILKFRKVKLPFPKLALSKILVSYIVAWGVFIKFLNILFAILSLAEYIPLSTDMQYYLLVIKLFLFFFTAIFFPQHWVPKLYWTKNDETKNRNFCQFNILFSPQILLPMIAGGCRLISRISGIFRIWKTSIIGRPPHQR